MPLFAFKITMKKKILLTLLPILLLSACNPTSIDILTAKQYALDIENKIARQEVEASNALSSHLIEDDGTSYNERYERYDLSANYFYYSIYIDNVIMERHWVFQNHQDLHDVREVRQEDGTYLRTRSYVFFSSASGNSDPLRESFLSRVQSLSLLAYDVLDFTSQNASLVTNVDEEQVHSYAYYSNNLGQLHAEVEVDEINNFEVEIDNYHLVYSKVNNEHLTTILSYDYTTVNLGKPNFDDYVLLS